MEQTFTQEQEGHQLHGTGEEASDNGDRGTAAQGTDIGLLQGDAAQLPAAVAASPAASAAVAAQPAQRAASAKRPRRDVFTPPPSARPVGLRCTAHVTGLAPAVTEELLYELFTQTGPVAGVKIVERPSASATPHRPPTVQSPPAQGGTLDQAASGGSAPDTAAYRYAFVDFVHDASLLYACRVLDGIALFGQPLKVKPSDSSKPAKAPGGANASIYVRNLHTAVDEAALWDLFSLCGDVIDAKVRAFLMVL